MKSKKSRKLKDESIVAEVKESTANHDMESSQIVSQIDLQLLIAVFVIFISAWVYLKDIICNFTISTPLETQFIHIIAHYVLTLYMILCLFICSIRGKYLLSKNTSINSKIIICFEIFMKTWASALCALFLAIITCDIAYVPLIILIVSICIFVVYLFKKVRISLFLSVIMASLLILCFPIFLSTMTILIRPISLSTKQSNYNLDEYVTLFVESKGYACKYYPVVLEDDFLHSGTEYIINHNTISIPVTGIKNSIISVGVTGPINSFESFICYPFCKLCKSFDNNIFSTKNGVPYFYNINININN